MILLENNFLTSLFDVHHLIEFGGLFLILAIIYVETGFFLGFVIPGGDYLLKAYPGVINYSIYILLLFVAIASFPMLKIMFSKKHK